MAKPSHRLISTTTVQPAEVSGDTTAKIGRIELTPCDLQLLYVDYIQKGLLFRKPQQQPFDHIIQHLKQALSLAISIFYPLAGRLVSVDNADDSVSFSADCNGAGAIFILAVADGVSVKDVVDPAIVPDEVVYPFFPLNGVLNEEGVSKPLLAVQVTELVDGLFVACSINHSVFDGTAFWKFFNTWSQISRTKDIDIASLPKPLVGHNYLEGVIDLPIRINKSVIETAKANHRVTNQPLQQRMFSFTKKTISELKAKANAEMSTDKISSLQALLAHLWVSITRNRRLNPEEEVSYCVIVGLRPRLDPPLSDQHLVNAVLLGTVSTTAGELIERGVGWAAWEMNRMIASKTIDEVKQFFGDWVRNPAIASVGKFRHNFLITGSSPRFDVYGNDFGWGKPVAVRSGPGNKFDGKLTVFAGAAEGSIDFEACLARETLEAMANDAAFISTLATPHNN